MNELPRYCPSAWSIDGVTVSAQERAHRRFVARKEQWRAVAAGAALVLSFTALAIPQALTVPASGHSHYISIIREAATPEMLKSDLREVAPDHWVKLIKFLEQYPRDESAGGEVPDPDPFT